MLSGPVGAGKSTVAKELVAVSPGAIACIEGDTFWSFIAKGAAGVPDNKNFKMIMRAMIAAATHYAINSYEVILDFSIPPWFLDIASAVAKFKKVQLDYVVLKPSEAVCAARAAARLEGEIDDYSLYHELYESFNEAGRYTISDDTSDAAALALRIRQGLNNGMFHVV